MSVPKCFQFQFQLVTLFVRGLTLNASTLSTRSSLVWSFEFKVLVFVGIAL